MYDEAAGQMTEVVAMTEYAIQLAHQRGRPINTSCLHLNKVEKTAFDDLYNACSEFIRLYNSLQTD